VRVRDVADRRESASGAGEVLEVTRRRTEEQVAAMLDHPLAEYTATFRIDGGIEWSHA
jgi:hypothetical protein